jgi:hypothetical protein
MTWTFLRRTVIGAALVTFAVSTNGSITRAQDAEGLYSCPAADAADKTSLTTSETIDAQQVNVSYPAVMLCFPSLEQKLHDVVDTYVANSVLFGSEYSETERQEFLTMATEALDKGFGWTHDLDFGHQFSDGQVVAVLLGVWSYTGGAHGNLWFESLVWDVAAANTIALEDLFEPDTPFLDNIATFVREDLYRQKRQQGTFINDGDEDYWIDEGAAAVADNYQVFSIYGDAEGNARGLGFHFAPYQVGAFAEGDFHVNVPAVVFDSYLRPERLDFFR